jgi:signal transduction histidine kinase
VEPEWCDAAEVVREVAALARIGSGSAVSINVTARGETGTAISPDALKQVLLNLIQNARDAVPTGLVLDIEVQPRGASTGITVCDNGPGIPPEIRARCFDPFFTTRATAGGRGLGLFVVEGVVRGPGGRVWVTSSPAGSGACFHILLPAHASEEEPGLGVARSAREEVSA